MPYFQQPIYEGCAVFTLPGSGSRIAPKAPFANSDYDVNTVSLTIAGAPFALALRKCRIRHFTIHAVTAAPVTAFLEIENASLGTEFSITLLQADIVSGNVFKLPGDGLMITGPFAINKDSAGFVVSVTYDWIA